MQDKYMAYVGSYSYNGQAKGITVYDVDVKKGKIYLPVRGGSGQLFLFNCFT